MANIGVLILRVLYRKRETGLPHIFEMSYRRMAQMAQDRGMGFFMSTFRDTGHDRLRRALVLGEDSWEPVKNQMIDVIWDRQVMGKTGAMRRLRHKIARKIPMVNDPRMSEMLDNKFTQYRIFPDLIPRSFLVNNMKEARGILPRIRTRRIVFKPTDEYGGRGVKITETPPEKIRKNTLVQEFIEARKIPEWGAVRPWDMRITVMSGRIDNVYIRIAKKGSFLSNVHKGGSIRFLDNSDIPGPVRKAVKAIDSRFRKFKHRIYSADFILDEEERPWLIEINSKPGIYYPDRERQRRFYTNILSMLKEAGRK